MTIDEFKKNIAPYMCKGWVAMDVDGIWTWYNVRPEAKLKKGLWETSDWSAFWISLDTSILEKIEPVENWTESLIEVGR